MFNWGACFSLNSPEYNLPLLEIFDICPGTFTQTFLLCNFLENFYAISFFICYNLGEFWRSVSLWLMMGVFNAILCCGIKNLVSFLGSLCLTFAPFYNTLYIIKICSLFVLDRLVWSYNFEFIKVLLLFKLGRMLLETILCDFLWSSIISLYRMHFVGLS